MRPWYELIKKGDPIFVSYNSDKWHGAFMGKTEIVDAYNITLTPEIGKNFIKTGIDCEITATSVGNGKSFYFKGLVSLYENNIVKLSVRTTPIDLINHPPELHQFMFAGKITILESEEDFDITIKALGINGAIGIIPAPITKLSRFKEKDIMIFMELPVEQGIYQSLLNGKILNVIKYKYNKSWTETYIAFTLSEMTTTSIQQIASTYNKPLKVDLTPPKSGLLGKLFGG